MDNDKKKLTFPHHRALSCSITVKSLLG